MTASEEMERHTLASFAVLNMLMMEGKIQRVGQELVVTPNGYERFNELNRLKVLDERAATMQKVAELDAAIREHDDGVEKGA